LGTFIGALYVEHSALQEVCVLVAGAVESIPLAEHHESVVLGKAQLPVEDNLRVGHVPVFREVGTQLLAADRPRKVAHEQFVAASRESAGHGYGDLYFCSKRLRNGAGLHRWRRLIL